MHAHVQKRIGLTQFRQIFPTQRLFGLLQQRLVFRVALYDSDDLRLQRLQRLPLPVQPPGLAVEVAQLVAILSE